MPNHWETSARPLFVKTVFINGNRHAVLFKKDPLLNCGNFPYKKISRSNSLLSFDSDLSTSSSESQLYVNEASKTSKFKTADHGQQNDLSSDLQNCLVKLKLASGSLEKKNKLDGEKCFCNSKESKKSQSSELKEKKLKRIQEKAYSKDQNECDYEEPKDSKLTERKSSRNSGCYLYNLENNKRKKNYCFVKISSEPPKFILNCSCENNWKEAHKCNCPKNNFVITATIHNIVMSSRGNENLLENSENSELYWNNYLTRSCYNSLSERVFQWLDLTKKGKKKETLNLVSSNGEFSNSTERIFSGKTFVDEIKKTEYSCENKILRNQRTGNTMQSGKDDEEVESEVTGEPNVETVVSAETLNITDLKCYSRDCTKWYGENSRSTIISKQTSVPTDLNPNPKEATITELSTSISNLIKSPLKIQDLFFKHDSEKFCSFRDHNKIKKILDASTCRNKQTEEENSEEDESIKTPTLRRGRKKIRKKSHHVNKFDSCNRQSQCRCSRNLDEYSDKTKSHILEEEFTEKNQKSINNLNITQTGPLLIQNLLSPQQQSKISHLQEEKIVVWASENSTGRPQLHIFLPTVQFRDQSDDSLSECDNFLGT